MLFLSSTRWSFVFRQLTNYPKTPHLKILAFILSLNKTRLEAADPRCSLNSLIYVPHTESIWKTVPTTNIQTYCTSITCFWARPHAACEYACCVPSHSHTHNHHSIAGDCNQTKVTLNKPPCMEISLIDRKLVPLLFLDGTPIHANTTLCICNWVQWSTKPHWKIIRLLHSDLMLTLLAGSMEMLFWNCVSYILWLLTVSVSQMLKLLYWVLWHLSGIICLYVILILKRNCRCFTSSPC